VDGQVEVAREGRKLLQRLPGDIAELAGVDWHPELFEGHPAQAIANVADARLAAESVAA
jgi:hypothetical protein